MIYRYKYNEFIPTEIEIYEVKIENKQESNIINSDNINIFETLTFPINKLKILYRMTSRS